MQIKRGHRPARHYSHAMMLPGTDFNFQDLFYQNLSVFLIFVAVGMGVIVGLALRKAWKTYTDEDIAYLEFSGILLLNMMRMLIVPLVVSTLITGMSSIVVPASGKVLAAACLYHMATSTIALAIGVCFVLLFPPINPSGHKVPIGTTFISGSPTHAILNLINLCFPDNVVTATFQRVKIEYTLPKNEYKSSRFKNTTTVREYPRLTFVTQRGVNVLGLVVMSITLGYIINLLQREGKPLRSFFMSINSAMLMFMNMIIWYAPFGIFFLIVSKCIVTKNLGVTLHYLGGYMCVIVGSQVTHGLIELPLLYFIFTRKNPLRFCSSVSTALLTAWATDSSSTTLPVTMACLIEKSRLNANVVKFIAPFSATFNLDGTMLYETLTCMFIANSYGYSLGIVDIIYIGLTSSAATGGANAIPQLGMMTTVVVLAALGLPTEDVTLIMSLDWLMDRFRTVINVWGDCVGAGILENMFQDSFSQESVHPDTGFGRKSNVSYGLGEDVAASSGEHGRWGVLTSIVSPELYVAADSRQSMKSTSIDSGRSEFSNTEVRPK